MPAPGDCVVLFIYTDYKLIYIRFTGVIRKFIFLFSLLC